MPVTPKKKTNNPFGRPKLGQKKMERFYITVPKDFIEERGGVEKIENEIYEFLFAQKD